MNIDRIKNTSKLDLVTARPDLRRDLHVFVAYVEEREVKRGHRDNALSKTDARRLAKLLSDRDAESEVQEDGNSTWVDSVDRFAQQLGLVHYDMEGIYVGYTSQAPSFPDNYIQVDAKAYGKLSAMNLARQEKHLLEAMLEDNQGGGSEFFSTQVLGRLNGFNTWGSGTAVVPMLDFAAIRRFLLDLLARCPTGEWLSVASLVEYLTSREGLT